MAIHTVRTLSTNRLVLRNWVDADLSPFAELNGDSEVMRYFPSVLTRAQSDELATTIRGSLERQGWGLWAVEVPDVAPFIGFVGLNEVGFSAHFTPAIEIGWRLARSHWGHGYATEAARASLSLAFDQLGCQEIVSFTATGNHRSMRVMERLGMLHHSEDDFDHPRVSDPDLRRHVLYRLSRDRWEAGLEPARDPELRR
jgi:RimJ/RimL family protein N-acetyltransferase